MASRPPNYHPFNAQRFTVEPYTPPLALSGGLTIPYAVLQLPVPITARFVLAELWAIWQQHGTGDGLAVPNAHFAARFRLSPRTVGRILRRHIAAGYVQRKAAPADRRHRLLRPLPLGTASPTTPAVVMQLSRPGRDAHGPTAAVLTNAQHPTNE